MEVKKHAQKDWDSAARKIRMVLSDVDGVLTSSHVIYDDRGARLRAFSTRDGAAIQWLGKSGIPVGFISALDDPSTRRRGEDLGVAELHLGVHDKLQVLHSIMDRRGLKPDEVAYFGDDLLDFPVLRSVGFACCPADAAPELAASCLVLPHRGGEGFFRAAAEVILKGQGYWDSILLGFGIH